MPRTQKLRTKASELQAGTLILGNWRKIQALLILSPLAALKSFRNREFPFLTSPASSSQPSTGSGADHARLGHALCTKLCQRSADGSRNPSLATFRHPRKGKEASPLHCTWGTSADSRSRLPSASIDTFSRPASVDTKIPRQILVCAGPSLQLTALKWLLQDGHGKSTTWRTLCICGGICCRTSAGTKLQ